MRKIKRRKKKPYPAMVDTSYSDKKTYCLFLNRRQQLHLEVDGRKVMIRQSGANLGTIRVYPNASNVLILEVCDLWETR
jgi:hypothetical protein